MDQTRHITIGPEFFSKAPLDYSSPSFALLREFLQNGVDAPGCDVITVNYDGTVLEVVNNGAPMSEHTLTEVFLSLGGTTKGSGSVGGFGKAKELLCFCHPHYKIESGDLIAFGSGASYKVSRGSYFSGTKTTISPDTRVFGSITTQVRNIASHMNWKGSLYYNGEKLETNFDSKSRKRIDGVGTVKVVKHGSGTVVRAGGVPMFFAGGESGMTIILELEGDTKSVLTANRDGMRYEHTLKLNEFIKSLSTNKRKALKEVTVSFTEYEGELLGSAAAEAALHQPSAPAGFAPLNRIPSIASDIVASTEKGAISFDHKFTIRNETGMKIDKSYYPQSFGRKSKKLCEEWTKTLIKVHKALDISDQFATGFVFSDDAAALYEYRNGVRTYYVSPVSVDKVGTFRTMRGKKLDKHDLLAFAVHEVVHGMGHKYHDEDFAAAFTYAMAKVMRAK